ncbi:protein PNS1 [Diospyros lotus]|uniref:protein PNS1 n=1 Tax=Diospyros lotus TaxID=55363 RepID=UPI002258013E|nr:protein PNS1 [Diospyros lotus]
MNSGQANSTTVPSSGSNPIKVQEPQGFFFRKLFRTLFYLHFLFVSILAIVLTVRGLLAAANGRRFLPLKWYLPLLASTSLSAIASLAWQFFARCNTSRTLKAAFWISPLLTCAVGVLLIFVGSPASLAAAAAAVFSSIVQSLYACWATPRFDQAILLLSVTLIPPAKTTALVLLTTAACTLYSCFLLAGIGGATATATSLDAVFIFALLLSLTWTMHVVKNTLEVTISRVKFLHFAGGMDLDTNLAFRDAITHSVGSICLGSAMAPVLGLVRSLGRAMRLLSGDADEFMFSCTDCCFVVGSRLVRYGNRWGFVQVGVYNKGFVEASMDTWALFGRVGLEPLIDSDLTSSFCFLCAVAGGSAAALAGGTWAFVVHRDYTTEVSIYAFLIGYYMCRVGMAWPQACVAAYYVASAEIPQECLRFGPTIPLDRIRELHRYQARHSRTTRSSQL